MAVLVCEPGSGVRIVQGDASTRIDCPFTWPCAPCSGAKYAAFCCAESRNCLCMCKGSGQMFSQMPCMPGVCGMCFSPCGQYLYQLSSDADSLHTRSVSDGELLYASPCGVFPRCLRQDQGGSRLLCAGGALNRAFLFRAPELTVCSVIQTKYPCVAADFWSGGLVLVCAGEGYDIQTIIYTLEEPFEKPKQIAQLPGMPCALCVCSKENCAMVSTWNGMMKLHLPSGKMLWNCPEWALCFRVECRGSQALASEMPDGSVWLFQHERPGLRRMLACAPDSQACFV